MKRTYTAPALAAARFSAEEILTGSLTPANSTEIMKNSNNQITLDGKSDFDGTAVLTFAF